MKSCSPLSQSCIFSHLTHHPMLCVCVWFQLQSTLLPCFLASLWCWQSRLHIHLTHYCGALCIPQPSNPSPNVVCVCGSNNNQHCSTAFLASLWCWQSRLHIHLTPYCGALCIPQPSNPSPNVVCVCGSNNNQHCSTAFLASLWCWQSRLHIHLTPYCGLCASHSHLTHHPMLCVCVVPAHPMLCVCVVPVTINTAPLLFWQAFGADKAGSTSILPLTVVFAHPTAI